MTTAAAVKGSTSMNNHNHNHNHKHNHNHNLNEIVPSIKMCGRRNNGSRQCQQVNRLHSSLVSGLSPLSQNTRGSIGSLVGGVNNLTIGPHNAEPQYTNAVPVYTDDYMVSVPAEKAALIGEEPPAYEKISQETTPEVATRELSHGTYNSMYSHGPMPTQLSLPSHYQAGNSQIAKLVDTLTTALTAYQAGSGRRRHVWKAQKALRNQLYEEEVARRQAAFGRLRCGERCEIWREVKAIDLGH